MQKKFSFQISQILKQDFALYQHQRQRPWRAGTISARTQRRYSDLRRYRRRRPNGIVTSRHQALWRRYRQGR